MCSHTDIDLVNTYITALNGTPLSQEEDGSLSPSSLVRIDLALAFFNPYRLRPQVVVTTELLLAVQVVSYEDMVVIAADGAIESLSLGDFSIRNHAQGHETAATKQAKALFYQPALVVL